VSGYLLDTNVLSEGVKLRPDPRVKAWVDAIDEQLLHVSVLTLGEIRKGIESLPASSHRATLESWLIQDLVVRMAGRILQVDQEVADRWGHLAGKAKAENRPLPAVDGLLAATAMEHNLTLVTRNTRDVLLTGVPLFNPWEA
jgi:predicted nucleic acid-binding protein